MSTSKTTTTEIDQQQDAPKGDQQPNLDAAATDQQESQSDQPEEQDDSKGGGNKEAAKYRRQLREVEAERDGLTGTVENLRRQLVAGNMPTDRIKPDALWATGRTAAEFFDESGQLDLDKLGTATKETAATLGVPLQDVVYEAGRGSGSSLAPEPSWSDAVKHRS